MKNSRQSPRKARPLLARGFTLIELIVAMAITSLIMIALLSLVGQSSASYTQTQRAVNAISQARAFIQFFNREISTRLPGTPLLHKKSTGSDPDSAERIAFVRTLSSDELDATKPGDLGTSIYYVDFTADGPNSGSPKLFRKNLDPAETQTLIETGSSAPFPSVDPTTDEVILPNILSFQALPQYRDSADGSLKKWVETSPAPPSVITLKIRFIDESSAQRFKTQTEWNRIAANPRENELQLVRTFTRNIAIAK